MVPVTCEVIWRELTEDELRDLREVHEKAVAYVPAEQSEARIDLTAEHVAVLNLNEIAGPRSLPIFCGPAEGTAISLAQQGVETERPMTHDLLRDVVATLGGQAREVRITELRDTTFYAELVVADTSGEERIVSCRPSDGVALAVRAGIPILVAEPLFELGDRE
jgi:hypothetical protein